MNIWLILWKITLFPPFYTIFLKEFIMCETHTRSGGYGVSTIEWSFYINYLEFCAGDLSIFCDLYVCIYITERNWLHAGSVSLTLTFASCCFCSLKGYCPYIMACFRIPCPFAWMLNQNAFIQDPICLWVDTRKKKLAYLLPKTGHSRRYLKD